MTAHTLLPEAMARIPEREGVTASIFRDEIQPAGQPVVMRGLVRDWPLVQAGEHFLDVLVSAAGPRMVDVLRTGPELEGRFFYGDDLQSFNFKRTEAPFAQLAEALRRYRDDPDAPAFYAGAIPLKDDLAALARDHPMPLLPDEKDRLVSLWIGNRTRTAPHWDLPQNLAGVIAGRRRFVLYPTEEIPNLYIGPLDLTIAGQPISLVDPLQPDLARFPRYQKAAAAAMTAILEPGDVLYMPSLQVHFVQSLDPVGAMINYWWRDGPDHLMTPFLTLLHGLLTLRDMPDGEREKWRILFDHYLFETNGPAMAHLPEEARGLFGASTRQIRARLREHLIRSLGGTP